MLALSRSLRDDYYTRAANEDCVYGEPGTRTKYHYDDALRISSASENYGAGYTWSLDYDSLDRLKTASKSGVTDGWTYDANGNRLTQTGTSASTFSPAATNNRLSSTTGALTRTYGYDSAGNATSYTGESFMFNQRGRMSSATSSAESTNYLYNALDQLIEKSGVGGTTLLMYDEAGHLLGEYSSTGALIQETVWMDDIPVATLRPNGTGVSFYFIQTDQLNAPRGIARTSDHRPVWRWDPDPFGTVAPNQNPYGLGTFVFNLRFPGQYYLPESGLHYNYFRNYDPRTGRYIESDPIGLDSGSRSTYSYVNSNPITNFDPLGLAVYGPLKPTGDPQIDGTTVVLNNILGRVGDQLGLGFGSAFGTRVHTVFGEIVRVANIPGIASTDVEHSFSLGESVRYGLCGSIRTDVVLRNPLGKVIAIYDVKTGNARMSKSRAEQMRSAQR